MIADLDQSIKQLLVSDLPIKNGEIDVKFDLPNREWSNKLTKPTVNLFLYDVRENTALRRTQFDPAGNGNARDELARMKKAPHRIDCFYMLTTWAAEPEDEHRLLTRVLMSLFRYPVLPDHFLVGTLQEPRFPIQTYVARHDKLTNPAEVWSALDNEMRPSVAYSATMTLDPWSEVSGPIVRTLTLRTGKTTSLPWFERFEGAETRLLGQSVEGRPLLIAETPDRPEFVLLIGRQHPPEVTGALGMQAFLDTVFGDTPLANRFRDRFKLGVVPLMNPDGVARGHWRHNVGDTDLNRDWGPFKQPETRAVMRWVDGLESTGHELVLVLDFHSTFEDLFYTQPAGDDSADFASLWLGASRARLPDFPFKHVPSTNLTQPNSKNYFHNRGMPWCSGRPARRNPSRYRSTAGESTKRYIRSRPSGCLEYC